MKTCSPSRRVHIFHSCMLNLVILHKKQGEVGLGIRLISGHICIFPWYAASAAQI